MTARIYVPKTRSEGVRAIASETAIDVLQQLGPLTPLRRASRVEPTADLAPAVRDALISSGRLVQRAEQWVAIGTDGAEYPAGTIYWADLSPVDGPTLGPFRSRDEAIAAEVAWLVAARIPVAGDPQ